MQPQTNGSKERGVVQPKCPHCDHQPCDIGASIVNSPGGPLVIFICQSCQAILNIAFPPMMAETAPQPQLEPEKIWTP